MHETEAKRKKEKRSRGKREEGRNALEENRVEPSKLLHRLLNRLDAVRLGLEVEREQEGLANAVRLLRNGLLDVLSVLLLLREVGDSATNKNTRTECQLEIIKGQGKGEPVKTHTLAPSRAARMAVARPIPESPPVMSMTLPSRRPAAL